MNPLSPGEKPGLHGDNLEHGIVILARDGVGWQSSFRPANGHSRTLDAYPVQPYPRPGL
jgi:hypothetical protein